MFISLNVVLCVLTIVAAHDISLNTSYVAVQSKSRTSKTEADNPQQDIRKINVMDVSLSDLDSYIDAIRTRVNYLTNYGTKLNVDIKTLERYISVWNGTFPAVMTMENKGRNEATCESADAIKVLGLLVTKFHRVEIETQILNGSIVSMSRDFKRYKTSMNRTTELFDKEIESLWKTSKEMQDDQSSAEGRISALETDVKGLTTRVDFLDSNMTYAHAAQKKTDSMTDVLHQGLDKVTKQVRMHKHSIMDIQNLQNTIIRNMSLMESKITTYYDQKINELNKKIASLEADQTSVWKNIRHLQKDLVPMKKTLRYLRTTLVQFMIDASANISKTMRLLRDADMEKYVGCYVDSTSRIMAGFHSSSGAMTRTLCSSMCRHADYNFYGLQAGRTCFCANEFIRSQKSADSDCSTPCTGDSTTACGGSWRMAIYKIYHLDLM